MNSDLVPDPADSSESSREQVARFREAIRRFVSSRVQYETVAEDLTQEIFMRVFKQLEQVRDQKRILGWLFQIARNVIADHFRASGRLTEEFEEHRHSPLESSEPKGAFDDELAEYIRSVVESLPSGYSEALKLTEYEGMSQVDLARHLGLSVSAAKSRVQRARVMLRDTIERCCEWECDQYGTVVDYVPRKQPMPDRDGGKSHD